MEIRLDEITRMKFLVKLSDSRWFNENKNNKDNISVGVKPLTVIKCEKFTWNYPLDKCVFLFARKVKNDCSYAILQLFDLKKNRIFTTARPIASIKADRVITPDEFEILYRYLK